MKKILFSGIDNRKRISIFFFITVFLVLSLGLSTVYAAFICYYCGQKSTSVSKSISGPTKQYIPDQGVDNTPTPPTSGPKETKSDIALPQKPYTPPPAPPPPPQPVSQPVSQPTKQQVPDQGVRDEPAPQPASQSGQPEKREEIVPPIQPYTPAPPRYCSNLMKANCDFGCTETTGGGKCNDPPFGYKSYESLPTTTPGVDQYGCGDGSCEPGETPSNCPKDCKVTSTTLQTTACSGEGESCASGQKCCLGLACINGDYCGTVDTTATYATTTTTLQEQKGDCTSKNLCIANEGKCNGDCGPDKCYCSFPQISATITSTTIQQQGVDQYGCGDGSCEPGETPSNCPKDCQLPTSTTIQITSTTLLQPASATTEQAQCDNCITSSLCQAESGSCGSSCGSGKCCCTFPEQKPTTYIVTTTIAGIDQYGCGDGFCTSLEGETYDNCPKDCPKPIQPYCEKWRIDRCTYGCKPTTLGGECLREPVELPVNVLETAEVPETVQCSNCMYKQLCAGEGGIVVQTADKASVVVQFLNGFRNNHYI